MAIDTDRYVASGPAGAPRSRPLVKRALQVGKRLWLLGALMLAWQYVSSEVLSRSDPMASILFPPPSSVIRTGVEMVRRGDLAEHVTASLRRELVGVGLAVLIAVPLGVAIGWWRRFGEAVDPVFEFLRPIPPLAWIPLSILWFGLGETQNQFIILLAAFFPVLLNTITGVTGVDRNLVRAALCLGAGQWAVLRKVIIRGALPHVLTGIRIGVGIGWMALVAAELVAATSGLGFVITNGRNVLRSDQVMLGMVVIGILGLAMDAVLRAVIAQLIPWHESVRWRHRT
jgi:ABC-type nitrate/sulfonate/bicarbonate transport system permease component